MEINPVSLSRPSAPTDSSTRPYGSTELIQAAVAAVRALNRSELLGEDRELLFVRDVETQRPVIKIVSRRTGEVVDQIPPETVLRILADLRKQGKDGSAA